MNFKQFIEGVQHINLEELEARADELGVTKDDKGDPKIFYNVGPSDGPKVHSNGMVFISHRPLGGMYGPVKWKVVVKGDFEKVAKRSMTIDYYGDVRCWTVPHSNLLVVGKLEY